MELEAWLSKVDDEGFACDGATRITDENHPLLALCRKERRQCFTVSRDGKTGRVRGLRRTCEEQEDNSNKAWSLTRRRVIGGRPFGTPGDWGATVRACVETLRASLFHVWEIRTRLNPKP